MITNPIFTCLANQRQAFEKNTPKLIEYLNRISDNYDAIKAKF
jgi:hypothetical protein